MGDQQPPLPAEGCEWVNCTRYHVLNSKVPQIPRGDPERLRRTWPAKRTPVVPRALVQATLPIGAAFLLHRNDFGYDFNVTITGHLLGQILSIGRT